jgi:cytochrome c-type biogenesis protein CcmH/NrfG
MREIAFSYHQPRGDRRHHVTEEDVRVVLERLPGSVSRRLKAVHFNDRGRGRRCLGYVRQGHDEIALCALPPRVSLGACLRRSQSPNQFGAVRGSQWPPLAVRRFIPYDVLLHELGHLQVIDQKAKTTRRRFASETLAQDFAEHWCRKFWSGPFDHPDPVHNSPLPEELAAVHEGWAAANADYKTGLFHTQSNRYDMAVQFLTRAVERFPNHALAFELLGKLTYAGLGAPESNLGAIELLTKAVRLDPSLFDANLYLGFALAKENREAEARRSLERAVLLDSYAPLAMAAYADVLADWSYFAESEGLFRKALKINPKCTYSIRNYGRCLIRDANPDAEKNLSRAVELFEQAVAVDPKDAESHYRLGDVLVCIDGEEQRGIDHLKKALRINPGHEKAAVKLAEIQAG